MDHPGWLCGATWNHSRARLPHSGPYKGRPRAPEMRRRLCVLSAIPGRDTCALVPWYDPSQKRQNLSRIFGPESFGSGGSVAISSRAMLATVAHCSAVGSRSE